MGIFSRNSSKKNSGLAFAFGDGKIISSREYGYVTVRWSSGLAKELLDECFGAGKPGTNLPGGERIAASPFVAHLYLTALHVGTYLAYAEGVLGAGQETMDGVHEGVSDALRDMRAPNGAPLEDRDRKNLQKIILSFEKAVISDLDAAVDQDPKTFNPRASASTELLIDIVSRAYAESNQDRPLMPPGGLSPDLWALKHYLDDAPVCLLTILKEKLLVRLTSQP